MAYVACIIGTNPRTNKAQKRAPISYRHSVDIETNCL